MSADDKARDAARRALQEADAEQSIAKSALAKNPNDRSALDRLERATRERERASMVSVAYETQHAEKVAAGIAEARALAKEERDEHADAASLSRTLALIGPAIDEIVANEARDAELVKSISGVVHASNQRMRLAYPGAMAAPLSLDVARELVRERIRRARENLARMHDPNVAPWVDSGRPHAPRTSAEIQAQFVARAILSAATAKGERRGGGNAA